MSEKNLGSVLSGAYGKAATVNNTVKGFEARRIEPFNLFIFEDSDFAPAATNEREDRLLLNQQVIVLQKLICNLILMMALHNLILQRK